MRRIFFTGCTHFNHTNIIKYCQRPFQTVEEMNEVLIRNWNKKVSKDDIVYHIGDVALCCTADWVNLLFKNLNGEKCLVLGNHDRRLKNRELFRNCFRFVKISHFLEYSNYKILLTHQKQTFNIPENTTANFYAHNHSKTNEKNKNGLILYYNVGVDANNFTPVGIDEILF
jgi:calcineurin-like phosphoesterase family protein